MKKLAIAFAALVILSFSGSAFADHLVGSDVAAGLIVVNGGLQWAYANPCPPGGCPIANPGIMGPLAFGWKVASPADFAASSWGSFADIRAAFQGKCAAAYFDDSDDYDHCDDDDSSVPPGGGFDNPFFNSPYAGDGLFDFAETLVVRAVPEPASLILLGTGLAALVILRKRSA